MARVTAGKGTTRKQSRFAQIPSVKIPRSVFNRSSNLKTTLDKAGILYPIFVDEALPGDTMNMKPTVFARMATPLHPVMDNLYLDTFFFAVPNRLLWFAWPNFMGEEVNPGDTTDYRTPKITMGAGGFAEGGLEDYFGMPTKVENLNVNAFYHLAYNLIWNEWFRDQNLQNRAYFNTGNGPHIGSNFDLLPRGKRHDYFTSCLPWPQKGDPVTLNLGTQAPLVGTADVISDNGGKPQFFISGAGSQRPLHGEAENLQGYSNIRFLEEISGDLEWADPKAAADLAVAGAGGVTPYADLSAATAQTVNDLREAFQLQRLYEKDARGGTRYTEIIRNHFGVISPDARLQRPEFLGGGSMPLTVNPVPQTSETATSPQGTLAAFVTGFSSNRGWVKSFTEHCVIIGLACVRADLNYHQGLDKQFWRDTRYDYYWPSFAHLGEQAVGNLEIYATGTSTDQDTFGYQERYAEYRYSRSKITGKMRSNATGSLDTWHLAQDFGTLPLLNETFITENPPVDRVIAVPSEPHFILDAVFDYKCVRPMPTYGVPGLIDHF